MHGRACSPCCFATLTSCSTKRENHAESTRLPSVYRPLGCGPGCGHGPRPGAGAEPESPQLCVRLQRRRVGPTRVFANCFEQRAVDMEPRRWRESDRRAQVGGPHQPSERDDLLRAVPLPQHDLQRRARALRGTRQLPTTHDDGTRTTAPATGPRSSLGRARSASRCRRWCSPDPATRASTARP